MWGCLFSTYWKKILNICKLPDVWKLQKRPDKSNVFVLQSTTHGTNCVIWFTNIINFHALIALCGVVVHSVIPLDLSHFIAKLLRAIPGKLWSYCLFRFHLIYSHILNFLPTTGESRNLFTKEFFLSNVCAIDNELTLWTSKLCFIMFLRIISFQSATLWLACFPFPFSKSVSNLFVFLRQIIYD